VHILPSGVILIWGSINSGGFLKTSGFFAGLFLGSVLWRLTAS
jgi:hypothetical protein